MSHDGNDNMSVFRFTSLEELAPYSERWDDLAGGVPFRSWAWLSTWWRHYGPTDDGRQHRRQLYVLCVFDPSDTLVGLAPWYLETSATYGRVLRFLGTGEVCSDHLSVLCQRGLEDRVTESIAQWLTEQHGDQPHQTRSGTWDLLELTGADAADPAMELLAEHLEAEGNAVHRAPGPSCWQIELPDCWTDYLRRLSKSHAKQLRRFERRLLATGRLKLRTVQRMEQLAAASRSLVDLHQRRWESRGLAGCFASPRFRSFHHEVMPELLRAGQLQLHEIELDGHTIAAEYHLGCGGVVYAYQSGIEPAAVDGSPGQLANMLTIRRAIDQGYRTMDFLRGDEPYKAHWRAVPQPEVELRAVPARFSAQLRHGVRTAGQNVKEWIKNGLRMMGARDD